MFKDFHKSLYIVHVINGKKKNRFFGVHVVYSSLRAICGTQDVNNHSNHPVTLDGREGEGMIKGMIIDALVKKGCVKRERRGIATKISRSRVRIATEVLVTSKTRRPAAGDSRGSIFAPPFVDTSNSMQMSLGQYRFRLYGRAR